MPALLPPRALNRALLARQHLLARTRASALETLTHLVGMQAQSPDAPYYGLWSRIEGFAPNDLAGLLRGRQAVRMVLMRSTIHLVTTEDALALRPGLEEVQRRNLFSGSPYGKRLVGLDLDGFTGAGRALFETEPRTTRDAGRILHERWPDYDEEALGNGLRNLLPLVQIPPRGVWGKGGLPVCATLEQWSGRPLGNTSREELILRYLGAFGPASVRDFQAWSGLTRQSFDGVRDRLVEFSDERGRALFDLPDAPRPDPDAAAPPRFLPDYDDVTLSHADRARIVPADVQRLIATPNGTGMAAYLQDGFVAGTWRFERDGLHLRALTPVSEALIAEGERLMAFAGVEGEVRVERQDGRTTPASSAASSAATSSAARPGPRTRQ